MFDKIFLILALAISWSAAIIELLTTERMMICVSYGIIVPILIFVPRIIYKFHKGIRSRFNIKLVTSIECLILLQIILNAPASLWWHSMGFQYDRLLHFAVSMINVPLGILIISAFVMGSSKKILGITVGMAIMGLMLFEGYQYSVDMVFGTQLFHDATQNIRIDVMEDIVLGILGVVAGVYLSISKLKIFNKLRVGGSYRKQ